MVFGSEKRREKRAANEEREKNQWNKIYIYIYIFFFFFRIVLQYNSNFRIVL